MGNLSNCGIGGANNGGCSWIIILILLFCCGGCGNNNGVGGGNSGCGCGCSCGCGCDDALPLEVAGMFPEGFAAGGCNRIALVIGMFSVIRLERPAQYLISGTEYAVPDKECRSADNDDAPCCLFRSMAFPTDAYGTGHLPTRCKKG